MDEQIVLNEIKVNKNKIDYYYSVPDSLKSFFTRNEHFYIEYPNEFDFTDVPESVLSIPFVMNLLPLMWLSNSTILVRELDADFFDSIDEIKKGFEGIHDKDIFGGELIVQDIISNNYVPEEKSCVLFSGGVDALSAVINHIDKSPVLINIWGGDLRLDDVVGHEEMDKNLKQISNKMNLEYFYIKSSLRYFYVEKQLELEYGNTIHDTWWHGMQHSVGMLSLLAPYNYIKKCRYNIIASSYTEKSYINKKTNRIISCSNYPFIDEKLKMLSVDVIHDGFKLTRTEKIRDITHYAKKNNINITLKVCFHPILGENCCTCEKCYRTIAGLCAVGANPNEFGFLYNKKIEKRMKRFLSLNMLDDIVITLWTEISDYIRKNDVTQCRWLSDFRYNTGYLWYKRIYSKLRSIARTIVKR